MKLIIDGSNVRNKEELHSFLKEQLSFPEFYGDNLDALWDCLTGWVELPLTIEWVCFADSKKAMGEYADKVADIFQKAQNELEGFNILIK